MNDIPVYSYDGELVCWTTAKRLKQSIALGRVARVVRNRKGEAKRVRLHRLPGEARATTLKDLRGTQYCFREYLEDGHRCYKLRALGERDRHGNDEYNLAPEEMRPIFIRVLLDCLVQQQTAA